MSGFTESPLSSLFVGRPSPIQPCASNNPSHRTSSRILIPIAISSALRYRNTYGTGITSMCLPVSHARQVTFSRREETKELEGSVVGLRIEPQFLHT